MINGDSNVLREEDEIKKSKHLLRIMVVTPDETSNGNKEQKELQTRFLGCYNYNVVFTKVQESCRGNEC